MGFFSRLGAMIRGFFGLFIGGIEQNNPEAMFEDIKNQVARARREAEQQIIEIQTNAEMIKIEMKNSEKNLNLIKSRVEAAQKKGEKDLLIELLMQEEEYQTVYETHKATYENAMTEVTKIREDFKIFESEMNSKLHELQTLKSQAKMASFKENINSMNARYTSKENKVGNINKSMDRARDIVNHKMARANAVESLNDENMDIKIKRLDMNSARDRARARAEALLGDDTGFEVKERIGSKENQ